MARIELFLVWESNCRGVIDEIQVLPVEVLQNIKVRIFLRKDTPIDNRPPTTDWIELYHTFTTAPYASDTTLAVFLIKYLKDLCFFSDQQGDIDNSCDPIDFYFIVDSETERKFEELIAILDLDCRSRVKMNTVNWQNENLLKILGYNFCRACAKMFDNDAGLEEHNEEFHNFFCDNQDCSRGEIRFYNQEQLQEHRAQQTFCLLCHGNNVVFCSDDDRVLHMRVVHQQDDASPRTDHSGCDFCPEKVFTSPQQRESHMRNTHKRCNCGCGVYFKTREHYLKHFYSVYPLACLENRKCPYRFQTIFHQAEHHKKHHSCDQPYYCILCFDGGKQGVTGTRLAFKDEASLRHHGDATRHTSQDMFLIQARSSKPTAKSSAINYC